MLILSKRMHKKYIYIAGANCITAHTLVTHRAKQGDAYLPICLPPKNVCTNPCRALAHVIRHPASEHGDEVGLGQHYENIHTRVTVKSLSK